MSTHTKRAETPSPSRLAWTVTGMDCPSCVAKIETALARMPGLSDIAVNFASETVTLARAETAPTTSDDVEKKIRALGFTIVPRNTAPPEAADKPSHHHGHGQCCDHVHPEKHDHDHSHDHSHDHDHHSHSPVPAIPVPGNTVEQRWWQSRKGRLVVGLGLLMGMAYAAGQIAPLYAGWIFTAAVVVGVLPFARTALILAFAGSPFSIETLMSIAALGAVFIGASEEAAAVVFLFAVGELLESVAANKARTGIKALSSLIPTTALRVDADGASTAIPASALRIADVVLVRPGDRVPADGIIVDGTTSVDESPITGESVPRLRSTGDDVFAGSINADGAIRVRVTKTSADNTIARIVHLVEQAQASKAPTARFIERFSRIYTPAVMAIAALVIIAPPIVTGADWSTWLYRGLALLLIACPCALVLSTPAAIASGLAAGTRLGLLIKGGNALETIGRVKVIAFDKTGTLTAGKPSVTDVVALNGHSEGEVIALAAALEVESSHPLAKAIVNHAQAAHVAIPRASANVALPGKAVRASIRSENFVLGSPIHIESLATIPRNVMERIVHLEDEGKTVTVLLNDTKATILGAIALRDEARPDARDGLLALKKLDVTPVMLTGDNKRTAQAIARSLGLDWQAELLPAAKLDAIESLRRHGKVAMVGDGINDAPALAAADVGIAMGGGTDVALETADAALLKSRVTDLAHLVLLSRTTMGNIRQNVAIALGLKSIFLVTSILGVTGLWMAVLADTGATAIVTLNALRLLRFRAE